jgi:site-specific DNA recombinase
LRSYVICDLCGRRMFGKTRKAYAYYACQPEARRFAGQDWFAAHPRAALVREDTLVEIVDTFLSEGVFGPDRRHHLADHLRAAGRPTPPPADDRRSDLLREIKDLTRRQERLITELENGASDDADAEEQKEFRTRVQSRFAELSRQRKLRQQALDTLTAHATDPVQQDSALLDRLPLLGSALPHAPEELRRGLYEALQLQVRYNRVSNEVTLQVTVSAQAVPDISGIAGRIHTGPGTESADLPPPVRHASVSHVLCAPERTRTSDTRFRSPPIVRAESCR